MKKLFTLMFATLCLGHANAQTITWGTPITVTSGSTYGNLHPRITLNRSGNPLVLWGKTDTRAYFSRWNGTAFTSPAGVGNAGINVFAQSWAGPDIASFGDTVYVTMKRTPETMSMNHMYMVRSFDGGMTFTDTIKIENIDTSMSRFPIVTTMDNGNPMISFMKFNASFGDAKYVVTKSTDYGNTFSPDVVASGSAGDVCDCCPAFITASGTKAVMLFRNNLSNIRDSWAGISTDGGNTFPNTMAVDTSNWMIMSCPSSGPDGFVIGDSIYSVFMSSASGTALVHFGRASISGLNASHKRITGTFSGLLSQNYPRMANSSAMATAVWVQNATGGKTIVYSFTNNISSGFSGYTAITGATGSGIMNADVAMNGNSIHIVWEDDNTNKVMYLKGTLSTTAIDDILPKNSTPITVYPNPSNDKFHISLSDIGSVRSCTLIDNSGRATEITPRIVGDNASFSLNGVAKGIYTVVLINDNDKHFNSKIFVE